MSLHIHHGDALAVLRTLPDASVRQKAGRFQKGQHWRKPKPHWSRDWWIEQYVVQKKSTGDIAREIGVTDANCIYWLRKFQIPRRDTSSARSVKRWGLSGEANPMFGRTGQNSPTWKGGRTPLRQQMYASADWRKVKRIVRERDKSCVLCANDGNEYHHIIPFRSAPLLALEPGNVCLLCSACHRKIGKKEKRWEKKLFALIARKEALVR